MILVELELGISNGRFSVASFGRVRVARLALPRARYAKGRPEWDDLCIVSRLRRNFTRDWSRRERSRSHRAPQATLDNETLDHLLSFVDAELNHEGFEPSKSMFMSRAQQLLRPRWNVNASCVPSISAPLMARTTQMRGLYPQLGKR